MKQKSGNEEMTIFQGKIMQGNHGVVACHEIKDSVFKGIIIFHEVIFYTKTPEKDRNWQTIFNSKE